MSLAQITKIGSAWYQAEPANNKPLERGQMRNWIVLSLGVWLGVTGMPAVAQEPLGIKLGPGLRLYPTLGARAIYDSNFFYASENEETAYGVLARPAFGLVKETNRAKIQAGARGELAEFDQRPEDDYEDVNLFAGGDYLATSRHRFDARVEREYGHDPFGARRTEDVRELLGTRGLDEFIRDRIGGGYRFGATDATFNLGYRTSFVNKRYDTNRSLTRFLDFDRVDHTGTLTYNYSPKTALILEGQFTEFDYDHTAAGAVPRDFKQNRIRVGASWQATAKTTGRFLVGRIEHDPDDSRRNSFSQLDWQAQLDWSPRARTTISFNTGRRTDDSFNVNADFINTQQYILAWNQRWTARGSTRLAYSQFDQNFEGIQREDEFYRVDLEGTWLMTRALAVVGGISYSDRDSSIPFLDFAKEVVSVGFRYSP